MKRLLWEKVIAESLTEAAPLFDIQGMAASAAEAQALVRVWKLPAEAGALSDEAKLFVGWQADFEKRCRSKGWIDPAGLHRQLIALIEDGHFSLPTAVTFAGYDRYTPLERDLMAAQSQRGVTFENQPIFPVDRGNRAVLACADSDAECAVVVAWVQAQLAANPACRLGIVAPDLAGIRDRLEFLLDDALHPALIRPDAAEASRSICWRWAVAEPRSSKAGCPNCCWPVAGQPPKARRMAGRDSIAPCAAICRTSPHCRP